MPGSVYIFIGTLLPLFGAAVVSAAVHKPANVTLTSNNMDLVLRWDPPEGAAAGVLYTAELRSKVRNFTVCVNTSSTSCDFSRLNFSVYGRYTGWVTALLGDESSGWANSNRVIPDMDTIIGRPNVTLSSDWTTIEVNIRDPEFAVSTLKDVYSVPMYNVTYWEDGQMDKARSISGVQHNRVILSDLEVSTRYCVQVQINTRNHQPSEKSRPVCESTSKRDEAPWASAVVAFFALAGAVTLVVVAVLYRASISHFLCPEDALPSHLKEYLLAPLTSAARVSDYSPPEEIFHQVSILSPVEGGWRPLEDAAASCTKQPEATVEEKEEER